MFVTFLDLLGFSHHVATDHSAANMLLMNYLEILNFRKSDLYKVGDKNKIQTVDSFINFIPCSDSLLITSEDKENFLPQLSRFLLDSFLYRGRELRFPSNPDKPHEIQITHLEKKGKKIINKKKPENWFPVLFRGGLSFGEVNSTLATGLYNSDDFQFPLVTGLPVVQAVSLESHGQQGPRILITKQTHGEILGKALNLIDLPFDYNQDNYELYWPGIIFMDSENYELELNNEFSELFDISIILWKAYRKFPTIERHYFNFMKLVFKSGEVIINKYGWNIDLYYQTANNCLRIAGIEQNYSFLL